VSVADMTRPRRTLTSLAAAALTISTSGPPLSATAPAAGPTGYHLEPRLVREAFVVAVYRVNTTVDHGAQDAYPRAAADIDTALAVAVAPLTPQWQRWTARSTYVDVQAAECAGDALPPATDDQRHHATVVTAWPIGRDGWRGPAQRHTLVCARWSGESGWRVGAYETG
jgi:hypothetical protein